MIKSLLQELLQFYQRLILFNFLKTTFYSKNIIIIFNYKKLKMSNIKQLIQKIFNSNDTNTIDTIKKVIYLAVNDSQNFSPYAAKVAKLIGESLNTEIQDEQIKKLYLQLLSQIATNYYQHIPVSYYNFLALINLLSDQNAEVRKASHYLLLIFIKKYQKIDEVLESYLKSIQQNPDHWKVIQKIIHSFQSLLVIQPKCITYGKNFESMDQFLRLLLAFRAHQHHLVQKASDQTVSSFVKNQYAPQVLPKLDAKIMGQLITYASKLNIKLKINKSNANMLHVNNQQQEQQLEQIKISQNTYKKSKKRCIFEQCLRKIQSQNDWKVKLDAVQEINNELSNCLESEIPQDMVDKILDLTYDYNFKTCITAMNIIQLLVTKYQNSYFTKKQKLEDVIIEKICDLKMAVRQIASKILKKMYETANKYFNKKLLTKLSNCSVVGKQQILNFIQENYKSSQSGDLSTILTQVSSQLMNENTRIKIKTIDCLVKLSASHNLQECKLILQKKINKVYYDMFLQRLKQKIGNQSNPLFQQNDKNGFGNKGNMTWQAQRTTSPIQTVDKQSMTKVEFGARRFQQKQKQQANMIDTIDDFSYQKPIKKVQSSMNEKKSASTLKNKTANTFDTFQSQQTSSYKLVKKPNTSTSNNINNPKQGNSFMSQQLQLQQQKKAPLKPNPIRRKVPQSNPIQKQDGGLIIQSKEYIDKANESQQPSTYNNSKYTVPTSNKLIKKEQFKPLSKEQQPSLQITPKTIPKQPFSIKKSTSINKQPHQVDYKATYYAAKEQLAPLDNVGSTIKEIIKYLPNDNDWSKQFDGLNLIRRFIGNHQEDFGLFYQNLPAIMPEVLKLVESLRSSLSKNAMITLAELCQALKKAMDPFLEPIFVRLFKKSQDANSFIVDQVTKCMTSLCAYCSSSKISSIIVTNSQTKSIPVKLKVALCVDRILQRKDYDIQCLKQNPKLIGVINIMISDSCAEVRNMIKENFQLICRNNPKNIVQDMFKKNSTKESWDKFKKILDKEGKGF